MAAGAFAMQLHGSFKCACKTDTDSFLLPTFMYLQLTPKLHIHKLLSMSDLKLNTNTPNYVPEVVLIKPETNDGTNRGVAIKTHGCKDLVSPVDCSLGATATINTVALLR